MAKKVEAPTKPVRPSAPVSTTKTRREIEVEEDDEDDDVDEDAEDDDEEEDDDDDDADMELDLDLDQEVGSKTAFDTIPAGTYPVIVMDQTSAGDLPVIRKVLYGNFAGQLGVNFGFKIVGPKFTGKMLFNEVPIGLRTDKGVSILALRLAGILGSRPTKISSREALEEVLEETRGMPCYIRVSRRKGKDRDSGTFNNVVATFPSDDKHPVNILEEEDDD